MIELTKKILGAIFIISIAFSCNKVDVEEIPHAISLIDDSYYITQGQSVEIDFLANDLIDGKEINISLMNDVQNGILSPIENSTKYIYQSNGNFSGTDKFNYQVCVGNNCDLAEVIIYVDAIPDSCQPIANNDIYTVNNGQLIVNLLEILENDINPCSTWDLASFNILTNPSFGSIEIINKNLKFTSYSMDSWTKDELSYEICDNDGICRKAIINLNNGDIVVPTQL